MSENKEGFGKTDFKLHNYSYLHEFNFLESQHASILSKACCHYFGIIIHDKFNNKCWKQNIGSPNRPGVSSVTYPLSLMLSSFGPRECEFGPATWLSSCKSAQRPHLLYSWFHHHRPNFSHAPVPLIYLLNLTLIFSLPRFALH